MQAPRTDPEGAGGWHATTAVQFYIPRLAAEMVDIQHLKFRARVRGIENATAEISYFRTGGRCRVTCQRAIAELLVVELETARDMATKQVIRDSCTAALEAIGAEFSRVDAPVDRPQSDAARGLLGC